MHKSLLKEIVLEQEKDRQDIDAGIPRAALSVACRHASLPHAVVVSGVRRFIQEWTIFDVRKSRYQKAFCCIS